MRVTARKNPEGSNNPVPLKTSKGALLPARILRMKHQPGTPKAPEVRFTTRKNPIRETKIQPPKEPEVYLLPQESHKK